MLRHRDADAIDAVAFVEDARARQLLGIFDQDLARRREGFGFAVAQRIKCIIRQIEADQLGMLDHAGERHGGGVIAHHGDANVRRGRRRRNGATAEPAGTRKL